MKISYKLTFFSRIDSVLLLNNGFDVVSVDASDKMLKHALKIRWERRKEESFDKWGKKKQLLDKNAIIQIVTQVIFFFWISMFTFCFLRIRLLQASSNGIAFGLLTEVSNTLPFRSRDHSCCMYAKISKIIIFPTLSYAHTQRFPKKWYFSRFVTHTDVLI